MKYGIKRDQMNNTNNKTINKINKMINTSNQRLYNNKKINIINDNNANIIYPVHTNMGGGAAEGRPDPLYSCICNVFCKQFDHLNY